MSKAKVVFSISLEDGIYEEALYISYKNKKDLKKKSKKELNKYILDIVGAVGAASYSIEDYDD